MHGWHQAAACTASSCSHGARVQRSPSAGRTAPQKLCKPQRTGANASDARPHEVHREYSIQKQTTSRLHDNALVLEVGWHLLGRLVVACQAVDAGLDKNQAELGVLVLAVALQMLAHRQRLLNQHVQVLGQLGRQAIGLQDPQDLVASHGFDLRHTLRVPQVHANLRWDQALLGQLANLVAHVVRRDLQPRRGRPPVRECRRRNALPVQHNPRVERARDRQQKQTRARYQAA
eukprot:contig_35091_g8425